MDKAEVITKLKELIVTYGRIVLENKSNPEVYKEFTERMNAVAFAVDELKNNSKLVDISSEITMQDDLLRDLGEKAMPYVQEELRHGLSAQIQPYVTYRQEEHPQFYATTKISATITILK